MNRRNQKITTYFVILSLLVIGVVYAILQANLQINGIAKIKSNTWDIHFNNIQINNDSVSIGNDDQAATIDPNDTSKVDFSITLSTPGDFYEFTVDVVNAGTIDGMIELLTEEMKVNNEVVQETPNYLNYIVTYEDDSSILLKHLLEAGETLTYKVRLEFKTDIEELPEAATINSSFGVQFVQADDTAIKKLPYYACTFDGELVQGAEYTNGQYTYRYMQEYGYSSGYTWINIEQDGWGVRISDLFPTEPITSRLCTSINDKPIISMSNMFSNSHITSIDTSSFNTSNVTNMNKMFYGCNSLITLDLSGFNTSKVTNMSEMFYGCNSLTTLDLSGFDLTGGSAFSSIASNMFYGTTSLKKIIVKNWKLPVDMSNSIFRYGSAISSVEEIDVTGWDLSNTTNAFGMLGSGTGLKRIIGLDTWNTSHITNMDSMFYGLSSLTTIDLSSFNTSNVTNMSNMFYGLSSLTTIDLSSFDTSNVTNTDNMFQNCTSLTTGYARTSSDANKFNNSSNKPSGVTFVVKS